MSTSCHLQCSSIVAPESVQGSKVFPSGSCCSPLHTHPAACQAAKGCLCHQQRPKGNTVMREQNQSPQAEYKKFQSQCPLQLCSRSIPQQHPYFPPPARAQCSTILLTQQQKQNLLLEKKGASCSAHELSSTKLISKTVQRVGNPTSTSSPCKPAWLKAATWHSQHLQDPFLLLQNGTQSKCGSKLSQNQIKYNFMALARPALISPSCHRTACAGRDKRKQLKGGLMLLMVLSV